MNEHTISIQYTHNQIVKWFQTQTQLHNCISNGLQYCILNQSIVCVVSWFTSTSIHSFRNYSISISNSMSYWWSNCTLFKCFRLCVKRREKIHSLREWTLHISCVERSEISCSTIEIIETLSISRWYDCCVSFIIQKFWYYVWSNFLTPTLFVVTSECSFTLEWRSLIL
jgi:hypothetical protein